MSTTFQQIDNVKSRIAYLAREIMTVNNNMNRDIQWIDATKGYINLGAKAISNPEMSDVLSFREKNRQSLLGSEKNLLVMHVDARDKKMATLGTLKAQLEEAENQLRDLEVLLEREQSQA
ncbi:hypothetical protein BG000_003420 [Podila horticola]|nr:hypothetical protein BG000_003420 [Podila horticola]